MNPNTGGWRRDEVSPITVGSMIAWLVGFLGLALLVARRLGAFDLWSTVTDANGQRVRVPNGLGLVDHPFHAVRAEMLRRALADGHLLRWIGNHQGGYPVEFYPLGVSALDVGAWALAIGSLPMVAIHKLVVIAIFLAPLAGYALMAGIDRRSLGAALVAGAGHLCVRGWWTSGGVMELYEWGLVTNVAAATALVIALPLTALYVGRGSRRAGAGAALVSAFALLTNPRAGFALAALTASVVIASLLQNVEKRATARAVLTRASLLLIVSGLLAAPEVIALARFNDLYYFVHYQDYADLRAYWQASIQAVGGPAFALGIVGCALALLPGARLVHRTLAITLLCYVGGTAALVSGVGPHGVIAQLELPRLMPFQRFLWFMSAAIAVEAVVMTVLARLRLRTVLLVADGLLIATTIAVLLLYVVAPPRFIPVGDRGLVQVPSSANPGIVDLEQAVRTADAAAVDGTALLVLGITQPGTLEFHVQLWAPLWSERPFFYDDWLWYWQTKHWGAYNPKTEHAYPNDASALDPEYLRRHGIGAIVVTGQAKPAASQDPDLTRVRSGIWDVYRVNQPTSIVTFDGAAPDAVSIDEQAISATGAANGGEILVRRNWFPRWRATINGASVPISETDDGYMAIQAPPSGEVRLELVYGADWIDWLARIAAAFGAILLLMLLLPRRTTVRLRPEATKAVPRAIPRVLSGRQ